MTVLVRYTNSKVGKYGKPVSYGQIYDRRLKKYVSHFDILKMLRSKIPFIVRERGTGLDITEATIVNAIYSRHRSSKAINNAIIGAYLSENSLTSLQGE